MYDVKRQIRPEMYLRVRDAKALEFGEATKDIIQTLALASSLSVLAVFRDDPIPPGCAIQVVDDSCEVSHHFERSTVEKQYLNIRFSRFTYC